MNVKLEWALIVRAGSRFVEPVALWGRSPTMFENVHISLQYRNVKSVFFQALA